METDTFELFMGKVAEIDLMFRCMPETNKDKGLKVLLALVKRCELFLGPELSGTIISNFWNGLISTDCQCFEIEQYYTPEMIVRSILCDLVSRAVISSDTKHISWSSKRLRGRQPLRSKTQNLEDHCATEEDIEEHNTDLHSPGYATTRKRKQKFPQKNDSPFPNPKLPRTTRSTGKRNVSTKSRNVQKLTDKKQGVNKAKELMETRTAIQTIKKKTQNHRKEDNKSGKTKIVTDKNVADINTPPIKILIKSTYKTNLGKISEKPPKREVHKCNKCGETFTHLRSLLVHGIAHGDIPNSCQNCNKEFSGDENIRNHKCIKDKKTKQKTPKLCRICGDEFQNQKILQEHMSSEHAIFSKPAKSPQHFCKFCNKGFVKKFSMYSHYKKHAEGKHVCLKCGTIHDDFESYLAHIKEHEKDYRFTCLKCGLGFHGTQQYDQHLQSHEEQECNICHKLLSRRELTKHYKDEHQKVLPPEEKPYGCEFCGKKFFRPVLLDVHMRIHTGEKPVECGPCKLFFRTTKALFKHKQTYRHSIKAGERAKERRFLCSECGKAYFRKHALQRHMRYHSGEKPHMCQYCGYKCREANNLKRHMALHFEAQRNFVCEICGSAFHAKKTLEMHHAYKHSEEREHRCSECSLTFKAKNALKRHMKVHSTEKEHKCWCGTAFKRLYNLRRHLKAVHGTDDILPPVRRVQTLDKSTKAPVSKTDYPDRNLPFSKTDIENMISKVSAAEAAGIQACNVGISVSSSVCQSSEPKTVTSHIPQSTSQDMGEGMRYMAASITHNEPEQEEHIEQHTVQGQQDSAHHHQHLSSPVASPVQQHHPHPHTMTTNLLPADHLGAHHMPTEDMMQRLRYNPPEAGMYGSIPMAPQSQGVDPNDPYMQVNPTMGNNNYIPQAVAYSSIMREYGPQFTFVQDGATYHNFVK